MNYRRCVAQARLSGAVAAATRVTGPKESRHAESQKIRWCSVRSVEILPVNIGQTGGETSKII